MITFGDSFVAVGSKPDVISSVHSTMVDAKKSTSLVSTRSWNGLPAREPSALTLVWSRGAPTSGTQSTCSRVELTHFRPGLFGQGNGSDSGALHWYMPEVPVTAVPSAMIHAAGRTTCRMLSESGTEGGNEIFSNSVRRARGTGSQVCGGGVAVDTGRSVGRGSGGISVAGGFVADGDAGDALEPHAVATRTMTANVSQDRTKSFSTVGCGYWGWASGGEGCRRHIQSHDDERDGRAVHIRVGSSSRGEKNLPESQASRVFVTLKAASPSWSGLTGKPPMRSEAA